MPENAEVYIIANQLNEYLQGEILLYIEINDKSKYFDNPNVVLEKYFSQSKLLKVYSRGKLIVFEFIQYWATCNLAFGKWCIEPENHSGLCLNFGSKKVYLEDMRHFARFDIFFTTFDFNKKLNKNGPDILADVIHNGDIIGKELLENWNKSFNNKRLKGRQICKHLQDQSYFSGIGNYLKSEILYSARIAPYRLIININEDERNNLLIKTRKIIKKSYESNGFTLKDNSDINGTIGKFKPKIYHQKYVKGKCIIKSKFQDGRNTYWCPDLQK